MTDDLKAAAERLAKLEHYKPVHTPAGRPATHAKTWKNEPPQTPGVYLWRRTWQWEPIEREITERRMIFSHRFEKEVPVETLGGQWFY